HVTLTRQGQTFAYTRQVPREGSQIDEPTAWQLTTTDDAVQNAAAARRPGQSEIMHILDHVAVLRAQGWIRPDQTDLGPQDQLVSLILKAGDDTKLHLTMNPQGHAKLADGDQLFSV